MAKVWVVLVRYTDEDPGEYGPYTELQAERVAARLQEEAEMGNDNGQCLHPHNVEGANAVPMMRYDQFLTGPERRALRKAVSAARKARERRRD